MSDRRRRPAARRLLAGLAAAAALPAIVGACELQEVALAEPEDVVIAEVVLLAPRDTQIAFLHRTISGVPADVAGARIEVRGPAGEVLRYGEAPRAACLLAKPEIHGAIGGTCYSALSGAAAPVRPGARYTLRIDLPDGRVLQGATTVPSDFTIRRPAARTCSLPPDSALRLSWSAATGTWVYIAETNIHGLRQALAPRGIEVEKDPLRLFGLALSAADTTILFPAEFGVFDRFNAEVSRALVAIQRGLPAGTFADVVVGAADRNYVNWARGGNFNPSGLVRVPSIRGDGTGFFGSLVLKELGITVGGSGLPPCGG